MISTHFKWRCLFLYGLLSAGFSGLLRAEIVDANLPSGTIVTADFRRGSPGLPTILLIHGFMQTREFPTITRLADGLTTAGFTTLAPTLSLGISRRSRSLPCEAIHRHTLEQDVAEIAFWMHWLERYRPGPVIIVGHSYGSLQSLIYAAEKPSASLQQLIALSLVDAGRQSDPQTASATLAETRHRIASGDTQLNSYRLGYCKKYVGTPQSFYSYARWSRPDIFRIMRQSKVPLEVIMGSRDERMGEDWPKKLRSYGNSVLVITGANHFFDAEHEFDVLNLTIALSKSGEKKN